MSQAELATVVISENAPNGARLLKFRGGDSIQSTASSIAFLWSNWDVLFRISKCPFQAEKISKGRWHGSGYGGSGEWHLTPTFVGIDEGRFEFYSSVRFLAVTVRGNSVFEYKRISSQEFSYKGQCLGELPPQLNMLRWLIEPLGNVAMGKFNAVGSSGAELITKEPSLVKQHANAAVYNEFLEMIEEENAILSGKNTARRFFSLNSPARGLTSVVLQEPLETLRRDLDALNRKLQSNSRKVDLSEYQACLDEFPRRPDLALVSARKIVEPIVLQVFQFEFGRHPGKASTDRQIADLFELSKAIPNGVTAAMRTVNSFGAVGAHSDKVPNAIDLSQFKISFSAILAVADWFYHSRYSTKSN